MVPHRRGPAGNRERDSLSILVRRLADVLPLRPGYYTRITFNDDAMASVLALLHDTARGQPPFAFVDAVHRRRAAQAVERGVRCILATQVIVEGQRTAWCAQHDEHTLAPAKARSYELP